jgi:hypothetical protein
MSSDMKYCADCLTEYRDEYGDRFDFSFSDNCKTCDDLIGETERGRLYRNNRPGREAVMYSELKRDTDSMKARYHQSVDDLEVAKMEMEHTMAYLQKFTDDEIEARAINRRKKRADVIRNLTLPQASGPEDVGKVGTEIAVASDVVPTPFVNYKRPVASPKMEVAVPFETESGVVMPPLPKHECELPKAVITEVDEWEARKKKDIVKIKDGSVFTCACGKNWFVRVQKVPYHISDYDPQCIFSWKPIRWFNFGRIMDLRNRKEQ